MSGTEVAMKQVFVFKWLKLDTMEKEMKTVPAFLRFWSELRSCVKVEVAVLGSRP